MLSVTFFLVAAAFVLVLLNAVGKAPLWVAVLLLVLVELLRYLPLK